MIAVYPIYPKEFGFHGDVAQVALPLKWFEYGRFVKYGGTYIIEVAQVCSLKTKRLR